MLPVKLHHIMLMIGNFLAWSDSGMNGQDTDVSKSVAQLATLFKSTLYIYLHQLYELYVYVYFCITCSPGTDPGGAHLKLEKIRFFGV
jgi:hypothetical protein